MTTMYPKIHIILLLTTFKPKTLHDSRSFITMPRAERLVLFMQPIVLIGLVEYMRAAIDRAERLESH